MSVHELQLSELLDCQSDHGLVRLHGQRVVILSAAAMGLLRKELIETLGVDLARRLLMRFGYADGYQDAVSLRDGSPGTNPIEHLKAGPTLHTLEGIVCAKLKALEYTAESGHFEGEAEWHNSYEGEQHVHLCGKSDAPSAGVSWAMRVGMRVRALGARCTSESCSASDRALNSARSSALPE